MTTIRTLLSVFALFALAACGGGGGGSGESGFGGPGNGSGNGGGSTPAVIAADLVIVLSAPSVPNTGTETVTATITALDANRVALKGVPVTISANNDAILSASSAVTGDDGRLIATIGIGANRENRVITVTAVAGALTRTASLNVVTSANPAPVAADIALALSATSIANSGTVTVTATVTAVNSNRNAISGIPITLSVDNDATVLVSGATTSAAGVVTGTIGIGANRANRPIRVTATSGTLSKEAVLQVIGTKVVANALPAVIAPSTAGKVQYTVTDASNAPLSGLSVVVAGPGGVQTTGTTDANGAYEYSYTTPAVAGTLEIRAAAGGVNSVSTVIVQGTAGSIPPVPAGTVRSASVRANPSVVAVNAVGQTNNRTEVRALFIGDNNKPVKNIRVRFDLNADVNSTGGTFTSGGLLIYSDDNGVAQTSYIPGTRFSPTDGAIVRACWDYNDFPINLCPNFALSTLTVIADPLSVSIGTDNLVVVSEDLVYIQRFVVQVNDSSGLAKADALISPLLDLESYSQGFWTRPPDGDSWIKTVTALDCGNEDVNRNGVLEVYSNGGIEDANRSGQLDPRKADVVVAVEGSSRTDASGRVILRITYPRNVGSWVRYRLTVAANGVSGTEGRASFGDTLIVPISAVKDEAVPAFVLSPYGQDLNPPRVTVTSPDGFSSGTLCTR